VYSGDLVEGGGGGGFLAADALLLVDVKVLLHHVHSIQADVCGDEVGPGGAEGGMAEEAEHGDALGEDHRVRDDAVWELLRGRTSVSICTFVLLALVKQVN
jgi:hypothetical protein